MTTALPAGEESHASLAESASLAEAELPAPLDRSGRPLTGEFWAHVDRKELVRPFCEACRRSFFVPQVVCGRCQSENWSYRPSAGQGVIYSYTVVHRAPTPAFEPPYVLAVVDIDESANAPEAAASAGRGGGSVGGGDESGGGGDGSEAANAPEVAADVWCLLTWIVDCPPERVYIGMKVQVKFVPGPDGALLPAFAPASAGGTPSEADQ